MKTEMTEGYLTMQEVAEKLKISTRTLNRMKKPENDYPIPYRRLGRRHWFLEKELSEWLENKKG